MLGLIDAVALAPLASAGAVFIGHSGLRVGLALVSAAGVAAAGLIVLLPRLTATERLARYRPTRWLSARTTSLRSAIEAWTFVSGCWIARAIAIYLLLGAVGLGFSFPLAVLFLAAGAAAAAIPVGPAATATQAGAGAGILIAAGVGTADAIAFAVGVHVLGLIAALAIVLSSEGKRALTRLYPSCAPA